MKEIRIHGRGGQGSVTAAEILAIAAFYEGRYAQAFPSFGTERRGAPVMAFARISDTFIRTRSHIYEPDYVIVQDPTLIGVVDVTQGLKDSGAIIINTEKSKDEVNLNTKAKIYTVNATKIALDILGVPIVNTAMIGAFAAVTKEFSLESLIKAVRKRLPAKIAEKNVKAVEEAYRVMER